MRLPALLLAPVACTPSAADPARAPAPAASTIPPSWAAPADPRSVGSAPSKPPVRLDEVMPGNESFVLDEKGQFDDWIELVDTTGAGADLGGWSLGEGANPDWTFPEGTTLPPGGRLLVWADGRANQGPLHAELSLSRDGDDLSLFAPDGSVVDTLAWPELPKDVVWGRFPSGSGNVAASIVATPWNPNPADPGLSLDPSDALFPHQGVILVDLYLDEASIDFLREHEQAATDGAVAFDAAWLGPVRVSLKGGIGSGRTVDEKCGWKLGLDEYLPGQRLRGLEHLTLNTMVSDPSALHETLAYALFRDAGVPAPRTAHVELWLNGDYRGLYLHVESIDDQFLKRWFDDPYGNLYEGNYGDDLVSSDLDAFGLDEQGANDVTDRSDLEALIGFLAQEPSEDLMPELERRVDLDRTLRAMAGEAVTAHWDGYIFGTNNYRLYHEPTTDRWTLLPWGTDNTFDWRRNPYEVSGRLAEFCLGIPTCRARYDAALWEMSERLLALDCAAWAAEITPKTRPLFADDELKEASVDDMDEGIASLLEFCETWPRDVLQMVLP